MWETIVELDDKYEDLENYSRRTCLLIHGVPEDKDKDTDELSIKFCKNHLQIDLTLAEISRSHRIGKLKSPNEKPRPIIIRFTSYRTKVNIYKQKRKLKGKKLLITESLSKTRAKLYKEAINCFKHDVWTWDCIIFVKVGKKGVAIRNDSDLAKVKEDYEFEKNRAVTRSMQRK